MQETSLKNLAKALVKVQGMLTNPKKDTQAFNYKYATLDQITDMLREPLANNGLAVVQSPISSEAEGYSLVGIKTVLLHESGETLEQEFLGRSVKNDPQAYGSLLTYYRRYAILGLFNLAPEDSDDDGQSAMPGHQQPQQQPQNNQRAPANNQVTNQVTNRPKNNGAAFVFPAGKFKGKTLEEAGIQDVKSYLNWMKMNGDGNLKGWAAEVDQIISKL